MAENRTFSDEVLLGLIKSNSGGGGGGGTNNYNQLENKPQIGGVTLTGNKTASDLGLADSDTVAGILDGTNIASFSDVETALEGKQDALTAGDYIDITGSEVSVDRELHGDVFTYIVEKYDSSNVQIIKKLGDVVMNTQIYNYSSPLLTVDDVFTIGGAVVERFMYTITLLRASTTYPAGTSLNTGTAINPNTITQDFEADLSGYKLVIKSEMDTAIGTVSNAVNAIKDGQTIDSFADVESALSDVDTAINGIKDGTDIDSFSDVETALDDKADKTDLKNEFIGTLAEWNALTTAQQKEYDTYQITDDYSEALMPNYSTTEQKTGQKWIDGNDIYFKVVDFGTLPNNTTKSVDSGLTNENIVEMKGFANAPTVGTSLPTATSNNRNAQMYYNYTNHKITILTADDYSDYSAHVVLYYTKTA